MQLTAVTYVRRSLAVLALVAVAVLPNTSTAAPQADEQKVSAPKVFHVSTVDEKGKATRADLLEGGSLTISSPDQQHAFKITGQTLDRGRVQVTIEDATESAPISAVETLIMTPGAKATWSPLAGLFFRLEEGDSQSLVSEESTCEQGISQDSTTEHAFCVRCSGRAYCCNPPSGYCCTVTACGVRVTHCH